MIHPYRVAAARPVPMRRSWWRNARRLHNVGDRRARIYPFSWRRVSRRIMAYFVGLPPYLVLFLLVPEAWRAAVRWPLYIAIGVVVWMMVDTAMGYLRLRRVRRAMRPKHDCSRSPAHWERCTREDGSFTFVRAKCLDCGRPLERDDVLVTATTFPALAAYRELARTGDVEAFAAKDLTPVTVHLDERADARRGRAG